MDSFTLLSSIALVPSASAKPATMCLGLSCLVTFTDLSGPSWLTGFGALFVLALFALAEWSGSSNIFLIEMTEPFMPIINAAISLIVVFAMFNPDLNAIVSAVEPQAEPLWAQMLRFGWAVLMGGLTWVAGVYRNLFFAFMREGDEDDDIGLLSLYSWMEIFFVGTNTFLALFVPVLAILFFAITVLSLRSLRVYLENQENNKRVACPTGCGTLIYGSALSCPTCHAKNPAPLKVGLLGQTKSTYVTDKAAHQFQLIAQKRCPSCAARLRGRQVNQICAHCGDTVLDSPEALRQYVQYYDKQLPLIAALCFVAGLVPFAGIFVGVVLYRLTLVSPMRRYVPPVQGCLGRWGGRMLNIVLISFQPIPVVGALVLPAMCFINYHIYRGMLVRSQFKQAPGQVLHHPPTAEVAVK